MWACNKCEISKLQDRTNFYPLKSHKSGFDTVCIICRRSEANSASSSNTNRRREIVRLKGYTCEACSLKNSNPSFFDLDHIKPLRSGRGRRRYRIEDTNNLQLLCPNCHRMKTLEEDGFTTRLKNRETGYIVNEIEQIKLF